HGGILIDPRIQKILNGYIKPGPQEIQGEYIGMVASPLRLGTGHGANPYSVRLTKDLNSELLNIIRDKVQSFVGENNGNLPEGSGSVKSCV
ncbi:MAG: hypothetical protein K8I82_02460, partial [Anaerolineae bacterium]|nr:hypothetical protein [Anaerolineae bacterium]